MLDQLQVVGNPLALHVVRGWFLNGGEPWGLTHAVLASGLQLRVVYAFEHPVHGLMLRCRESWIEDGGLCSQDRNVFISHVESLVHPEVSRV